MNGVFSACKEYLRDLSAFEGAVLFLLLILIPSFSQGELQGVAVHALNIKQVTTDKSLEINANYEYGKNLYPQYSYHGLPKSFFIKKSADISFRPSDIESIEIRKPPFIPPGLEEFTVTITFSRLAGQRLRDYTEQNVHNKIALEIDNSIFVIATIMDPMETVMNITVGNRSIAEIKDELSKISENIIVQSGQK